MSDTLVDDLVQDDTKLNEGGEDVLNDEVADDTKDAEEKADHPWMTQLGKDYKGDETARGFDHPSKLLDAYKELKTNQDKLTEGMIKIPGEGSSDEEYATFYNAIGRPDTTEGYEIPAPQAGDGVEESVVETQKLFLEGFTKTALDLNLSKKQAQGIYEWYVRGADDLDKEQAKSSKEAKQASQDAIKDEWGADYDTKLKIAQRGAATLSDKDFLQAVNEAGLENHPGLMKFFFKVGELIGEDNLVEGNVGPEEKPKNPWDKYEKTTPTEGAAAPVASDDEEQYRKKYPASNFQG